MVLIGIDPHKASHTAVVIDRDEQELARATVRADRGQVGELLAFAAPFTDRRWAIESAYYERKLAAGKGSKGSLSCLKRRLSDVVFRVLVRTGQQRTREG